MTSVTRHSLLVLLLLLSAACASKKALDAFNKAKEYDAAGLYVDAAEQDLRALRERSDFKEALLHLREVAPKAYAELIDRGEKLTAAGNLDQAVSEYERVNHLLNECHHHGVVFETSNVSELLTGAQQRAAEQHFTQAESYFDSRQWRVAADEYVRAHEYRDNYNGSFDKAIQSLVNSGDSLLTTKSFSAALEDFARVLRLAPGHSAANLKMAEGYYLWGKQSFVDGRYREALTQFETVYTFMDDYRDVAEWVERAYEEATQYVAIFPFSNRSPFDVDGYFFAAEILNRVFNVSLDFVEFLPYSDMVAALDELHLNLPGRLHESDLLRAASREKLDAFVWGVIRDIEVKDSPETLKELEHEVATSVKDSLGRTVTEKRTIFYREYTAKRFVRMSVDGTIYGADTAGQLDHQRFVEDITDEARWVGYQGSIYDLPEDKRALLDAPRDPKPAQVLIDELAFSISEDIAKYLIKYYK